VAPRPTLDEIFAEEDEFGLLEVTLKPLPVRSTTDDRDAAVVGEVNAFYERHGRLPDDGAADPEEMRIAVIWRRIRGRESEAMRAADRHGLLGRGDDHGAAVAAPEPDWREDVTEDDVPASLDDIFSDEDGEALGEIDPSALEIRHVTPAAQRETPDHRAEARTCADFETFRPAFEALQGALESGERQASRVELGDRLEIHEGDVFIRKGLLAYVAEKTEPTVRRGKREHRLRVVFSNGTESDPLMLSFRKSLAEDPTARRVDRPGGGPLFPEWEADQLELTGTIYVARSLSEDPKIREVAKVLHKIGVTSQDVHRRVADARNDPTFLLAPVEIVATYDLVNLSRRKVEHLLHRFFAPARPAGLWITDRFGKKVHPREWFYVLPQHVSEAAAAIRDGMLHLLEYDPMTQKIRRRDARDGSE